MSPGKDGMYLAKEEIAEYFGTGSYGTVGWACHGVASRMQAGAKFRERVSSIRQLCQKKMTPPSPPTVADSPEVY